MTSILITGLDGSGKSTLLKRLEEAGGKVLRVPYIDTDGLHGSLLKASECVNNLNIEADQQGIHQIKAVALFASMLLFPKLMEAKTSPNQDYLFFERHPLFDTGVYASFYAHKLGPESLSDAIANELNQKYATEFAYITQQVPMQIRSEMGTGIQAIMYLIYRWFHLEQKRKLEDLQELFPIPLPDQIWFLKAPADVLYDRIKEREVKEAHETPEILQKLDAIYQQLCQQLSQIKTVKVALVNAADFHELDRLTQHFISLIREH